MHTHSLARWQHAHEFLGAHHERNERRTKIVIGLALATMVGQIIAGHIFGSMALVAEGWHMSTHAGMLSVSAFAYSYARRHRDDPRFAFGTGKLGELAAFTSAIALTIIALLIVYESVQRLLEPVPISFVEAIAVAAVGLPVNLASAWLLSGGDHHHHDDEHGHHHHHHRDNNIRAAFIHVMTDAATAVLAVIGLSLAWLFGWLWMDPITGILGAIVIVAWASTLIHDTGRVLLDMTPDLRLADRVRARLETDSDRVADLHLWQIGPGHHGIIITLVSTAPREPSFYKAQLAGLSTLSHITIEVYACEAETLATVQSA